MKRAFYVFVVMLLLLAGGCSDLLGGGDADLGDFTADELPAAGATKPASTDEAKTIYTEASTVLFEAMDAQTKRLSSKETQSQTIDQTIDWSNEKVSMKGTIKGKINTDFPADMTAGTYTVMDSNITFSLNGEMTDLEVTDPEDSSKSYVISGKIEHSMITENFMKITIAGSGETMTFSPEGQFKTDVSMKTAYSVKRKADGKGAKFVLTFTDKQDITITPEAAGVGQGGSNGGMGDPTCGYFEKTAKLTAYDDAGQVIFENVDVPLSDIPWMMGQAFGAGGGAGPGPGGEGGTEDNANQALIRSLLGALDKAVQAGPGTGFVTTVEGSVQTRTFTTYSNSDGVVLNGTEKTTFGGTPPNGGIVAGDMNITFSNITDGPFTLILKMNQTGSNPPEYTECSVNGTDMLSDYKTMAPSGGGQSGGGGGGGFQPPPTPPQPL